MQWVVDWHGFILGNSWGYHWHILVDWLWVIGVFYYLDYWGLWVGLMENLQETMVLTIKNVVFSCKISPKPIHWFWGLGFPNRHERNLATSESFMRWDGKHLTGVSASNFYVLEIKHLKTWEFIWKKWGWHWRMTVDGLISEVYGIELVYCGFWTWDQVGGTYLTSSFCWTNRVTGK